MGAGRDDVQPRRAILVGMNLRHSLVTSHTSGARSNGSKGAALAVLATAQLVIALDYSIVNMALPDIGRSWALPTGRSSG
jgi:hypothetical protein